MATYTDYLAQRILDGALEYDAVAERYQGVIKEINTYLTAHQYTVFGS